MYYINKIENQIDTIKDSKMSNGSYQIDEI